MISHTGHIPPLKNQDIWSALYSKVFIVIFHQGYSLSKRYRRWRESPKMSRSINDSMRIMRLNIIGLNNNICLILTNLFSFLRKTRFFCFVLIANCVQVIKMYLHAILYMQTHFIITHVKTLLESTVCTLSRHANRSCNQTGDYVRFTQGRGETIVWNFVFLHLIITLLLKDIIHLVF